MKSLKANQGFTLIELVVVIVILGILAVTAAPKFMSLSSDARVSTLNGVKAALQSANSVVYSKAILASEQNKATGTVAIGGGVNVATAYGYTAADAAEVAKVLDLDTDDFTIEDDPVGSDPFTYIRPTSFTVGTTSPALTDLCGVVYRAATSSSKPKYEIAAGGC